MHTNAISFILPVKNQTIKHQFLALFLEHLILVINCYNILICDEHLRIKEIVAINTY